MDYSVYPDIPKLDYVDKEYLIGNFDSTINFSNRSSLTMGLRYQNYEYYDTSQYVGFYANFHEQINERCHFYLGINSEMEEIENSFEKNYAKFYSKLTYLF